MFPSRSGSPLRQKSRSVLLASVIAYTFAMALCTARASAQTVTSPVPSSIVSQYGLDTRWYGKYVDAWGVPVLGSYWVSNQALLKARAQLGTLLWTNPYWPVPSLNSYRVRVVILARSERMSSIPEVYAMYGTSLDSRYWGGMGATASLPITVGTEANLLDNYGWENVFAHEFGHTLMDLALSRIDPNFNSELNAAWNNAWARGLWTNTYARSTIKEYWAEGLQSYFNVNYNGPVGGDGVHNHVNTRSELYSYDPRLYNLLNRIYQGRWLP